MLKNIIKFVKLVKFLYICPFSRLLIVHCTLSQIWLSSYTCSMRPKSYESPPGLSQWLIQYIFQFSSIYRRFSLWCTSSAWVWLEWGWCWTLQWISLLVKLQNCGWMPLNVPPKQRGNVWQNSPFEREEKSFQGITSIFSNQPANLSIGFIVYKQK